MPNNRHFAVEKKFANHFSLCFKTLICELLVCFKLAKCLFWGGLNLIYYKSLQTSLRDGDTSVFANFQISMQNKAKPVYRANSDIFA